MPIRKRSEAVDTVSDQIRALARQGLSRAQIAEKLGKRYQHVWNVLNADAQKPAEAPSASTEHASVAGGGGEGGLVRMTLREDGSIILPSDLLGSFGFEPGRPVVARREGGKLVILSRSESVREVQAWARELAPQGVDMTDALIAERRAAAARGE